MNKKLYFLVSITFLYATTTLNAQSLTWVKQITTPEQISTFDMHLDNGGNVYTVAAFQNVVDFDPGSGIMNLNSLGSPNNVAILKLDNNGNFVFALGFFGSGSASPRAITTDGSGNIYVTGVFSGSIDFDPGAGTNTITSTSGGTANNGFICKLDAFGNFLWVKSLGVIVESVAIDGNGNVITTGRYAGTMDFDPNAGVFNLTSTSCCAGTAIFISKLDVGGNLVWAKSIDSTAPSWGTNIITTSSNDVLIIGDFQGIADFDPNAGVFNLTSGGGQDGFCLKLDAFGNFIWAKNVGNGTSIFWTKSLTLDVTENIYIAGSFNGTVDMDPGVGIVNLVTNGSLDVFTTKLSSSGNFVWTRQVGSTGLDWGNSVSVSNQNVVISGTFQGLTDFDPNAGVFNLSPQGSTGAYLLQLDTASAFVCAFEGAGGKAAIDATGNYYISGAIGGTVDVDPSSNVFNLTSTGATGDPYVYKGTCSTTLTASFTPSSTTICQGDSITFTDNSTGGTITTWNWTFNGGTPTTASAQGSHTIAFNTAGTFNITLEVSDGTNTDDTTITVMVNPAKTTTQTFTECQGFSIAVGANTYSTTGIFTDTLVAANGCDSIVTINLTINPLGSSTNPVTICQGDSLFIGGAWQTTSGIYTDIITGGSSNGCDSVVNTSLTVGPQLLINNNWYFGENAGIDFNTSPPTALTNSAMNQQEGVATISDNSGNLLFYTNGVDVWNVNHQMMPNGTGLMGDNNTTSCVITPKPGSTTSYFIITADNEGGPNGLRYTEVDMTLQGGLGDVVATVKNVLITSPVTEGLTIVPHANQTDYWLVAHRWGTNDYLSYLITATGISGIPVFSPIGVVISGVGPFFAFNAVGYLKSSPDNNRIAHIVGHDIGVVQLLDFNATTGQLNNLITLTGPFSPFDLYGVEFSPNNNLLYVSEAWNSIENSVYQYDLSSGVAATINASQITLNTNSTFTPPFGSLQGSIQLAPDGKIYLPIAFSPDFMDVINNPNVLGFGADYVRNGFNLAGRRPKFGLPQLIKVHPMTNSLPTGTAADSICQGDSIFLGSAWQTLAGVYNDTIPNGATSGCDSIVATTLTVLSLPVGTTNESICQGDSIFLGGAWQTLGGTYNDTILGASINGCDSVISTNLSILLPATFTQTPTICQGQSFTLPGGTIVTSTGIFIDTLQNAAVSGCDSIVTTNLTVSPAASFTQTFTECQGFSVTVGSNVYTTTGSFTDTLTTSVGCDSIVTTNLTILTPTKTTNVFNECEGFSVTVGTNTYTTTGIFTDVINNCDTIETDLTINPTPQLTLIKTDDNCGENIGSVAAIVSSNNPPITYSWNTGSADSVISNLPAGTYSVTVNDGSGCAKADTVDLAELQLDCDFFVYTPNAFTPNGDGNNDVFFVRGKGIATLSVKIYNRWGNKVFEITDVSQGWDGTYKGAAQNTAVFVYVLEATFLNEKTVSESGDVSLIR